MLMRQSTDNITMATCQTIVNKDNPVTSGLVLQELILQKDDGEQPDIVLRCESLDTSHVGKCRSNTNNISDPRLPDRKWFILASSCINLFLMIGVIRGVSVLYVDIIDVFQTTRAQAALINSLLNGFQLLPGILSGVLVRLVGCRVTGIVGGILTSCGFSLGFIARDISMLIFFVSVIGGIGMSMLFVTSQASIGLYFKGKSLLMAISVASLGGAFGGTVFPYMISFINEEYGLRGCFLIIGGVFANSIWAAAVCKPKQSQDDVLPNEVAKSSNKGLRYYWNQWLKLFKNPYYMMAVTAVSIAYGASAIPVMLAVDYFQSKGHEKHTGVFFVILMNIASLPGRILPGILKQIPGLSIFVLNGFMILLVAIPTLLLPIVDSYTMDATFSIFIGFSYGFQSTVSPILSMKLVDTELFSFAVGLMTTFIGVSVSIASPLGGYTKDITGSYSTTYYVSGGCLLFGSVLFFLEFIWRNIKRK